MIKYEENLAARLNGNNLQPLAGASVTVTDKATGLAASLYQDDELTPIPQPLTTDNNGYFAFRAADGRYTLTFSAGPNSSRFDTFTREVVLEDPADNPFMTVQELALPSGAAKVGYGSDTVAGSLDALQMADYTALRAYSGARKNVYVTDLATAGMFVRDDADTAVLGTPVNTAFSTAITGGTLAAGTYYYRVSAIDAYGETLASAETSIAAAKLAAPAANAPTTATTGGTLAAATYYYKVTALGAAGETIGSNEVSIATTGTTSTVTVTWGAVTGATGYRVYRGTAAGGQNAYYAPGNVTTFTDTGAASTAGSVPTANTATTNTNTVTVNWGEVTGATGYKVYGRTAGAELFMATLGAVTTWTDTGSITPAGELPTGYKKDNGSTVIQSANGKRWKRDGFTQSGTGAVLRTMQDKARETVSVKDFGAKGDGVADDGAAFSAAIASGKAVMVPPGEFRIDTAVTTDLSDVVIFGVGRGASKIVSHVATGHAFILGTSAVTGKGGLRLRNLTIARGSGTHSAVKITENLNAIVDDVEITGFYDYAIEAEKSDGLLVRGSLLFQGSIKAYSEMDRLVITENDIQAAQNKPAVEVYGGSAVSITKNFINWNNHEAIVVGYDSARGDYTNTLTIAGNYIERNCMTDLAGAVRPFVHIGKPIDQTGAVYAGSEVVRSVDWGINYLNADVANPNIANVVPVLFERVIEANYNSLRTINFTNGGANANSPRVKYPARNIHLKNHNTKYIDLSTGGQGAYQQVTYDALSMYRTVEIYLGTITVATDAAGAGTYNFTGIDTGVNGLDSGRLLVLASPEGDCRHWINNKTISAGTASDGSDLATWRINVAGGPASSSVPVTVRAVVTVP